MGLDTQVFSRAAQSDIELSVHGARPARTTILAQCRNFVDVAARRVGADGVAASGGQAIFEPDGYFSTRVRAFVDLMAARLRAGLALNRSAK